MANPRFNNQVTNRRGAMKGGRMKKMGGGMTRKMYSKGGAKPDETQEQEVQGQGNILKEKNRKAKWY